MIESCFRMLAVNLVLFIKVKIKTYVGKVYTNCVCMATRIRPGEKWIQWNLFYKTTLTIGRIAWMMVSKREVLLVEGFCYRKIVNKSGWFLKERS